MLRNSLMLWSIGAALAAPASAHARGPQATATAAPVSTPRFSDSEVPDPQQVLALLDSTAAAQIAQLRARPFSLTPSAVEDATANWVSAAFYTGLGRLTRLSDKSGGTRFLRQVAEHYNYAMPGASSDHSRLDADNVAVGELYEELYSRSAEPGQIAPLRERLDWMLPFLALEPAPQRLVWWWSDALFMAPPVLARFSMQTGDAKYLDAMDKQWWRTHARLWSEEDGLYLRDARFAERRTKNGKKVFWGRGNGWVMGALPRVLEAVPAGYPSRQRYIATLQAMAKSLARLQQRDGLWTASLLDVDDPAGPETSGSAFFTYGLAWGINHGVLDRKTYLPVVLRAWSALARAVQPDGLVGHVQRTGDQPWPTKAQDHALYGTGALLLAGLEVMKLGQPVQAFPAAEPARPQRRVFAPPAERAPPPGLSPEELAGFKRRQGEERAVHDLAFEPARDMPADKRP